jgi:hypothetical protein
MYLGGRQWRNQSTNDTDLANYEKAHGWEDAKDDYVVLDGENSVGRIYKEHGEHRWFWSVTTLARVLGADRALSAFSCKKQAAPGWLCF